MTVVISVLGVFMGLREERKRERDVGDDKLDSKELSLDFP